MAPGAWSQFDKRGDIDSMGVEYGRIRWSIYHALRRVRNVYLFCVY